MKNRILVAFSLVLFSFSLLVQGQDIRGRVSVGGTQPFSLAEVKIEIPGQTKTTKTDKDGVFRIAGIKADRVLISVFQGGDLVFRGIRPVTPGVDLVIDLAAIYAAPSGFAPVALGVLSNSEVYVADRKGPLQRFVAGNFDRTIAMGQRFVDLAASVVGGRPYLFACVSNELLVQYDTSGSPQKRWTVPCDSVAVDSKDGMIYVGDGKTGTVNRLRQSDKGQQSFANFGSAVIAGLGAMAVDTNGRRLFVSDTASGEIRTIGLDDKKLARFARGLGQVQALAIDASRQRLYAADPREYTIWQFSLVDPAPVKKTFLTKKDVPSVYALGVDQAGTVWVGDRDHNGLFSFSPDGELRSRAVAK